MQQRTLKTKFFGPTAPKKLPLAQLTYKAVETAALWKQWKKQKAFFPQFPQRLENAPPKNGSAFPTVPTASTAGFLSFNERKNSPASGRF